MNLLKGFLQLVEENWPDWYKLLPLALVTHGTANVKSVHGIECLFMSRPKRPSLFLCFNKFLCFLLY